MTKQEIFDHVAKFLIKQGQRSTEDRTPQCLYRRSDGKKCAVGCLLTEEEYSPDMEGAPVSFLIRKNLLPLRLAFEKELLDSLQKAHDTAREYFPRQFKQNMIDVAGLYGLSTLVFDEPKPTTDDTDRFNPSSWGV